MEGKTLSTWRVVSRNIGQEGDQEYGQLSGGTGMMPPSAPFAKPGPGQGVPKARPNYSRLGMCETLFFRSC